MNYIFLNPREWSVGDAAQSGFAFSQDLFPHNVFTKEQSSAERTFINDFDDELVEVITLGGWNERYVEVVSKIYRLKQDTEYSFVFWLNGGENENSSETCLLKVDFSGSAGYSNVYKLNRNYIKPKLHCQGWELYVIKFRTPGAASEAEPVPVVDTRFIFAAGAAPMAVKPAKEPDFYKDWKDEPDEFAAWRPQRHNLVFEDGWPSLSMYGGNRYSTEMMKRRYGAEKKDAQDGAGGSPSPNVCPDGDSRGFQRLEDLRRELYERYSDLKQTFQALRERCQELASDDESAEELEGRLDGVEDCLCEVEDRLCEMEDRRNEMEDRLNEAEDVFNEAEDLRDEVSDQLDEIVSQLEEMATGLQKGANPKD